MERTRAENRFNSRIKALRKRRIDRQTQGHYSTIPYYDNLHQYSNNKIHCSCPLCSRKSKNYLKINDMRKNEAMDFAIKDSEEEEEDES